jgi:hypothetical protein
MRGDDVPLMVARIVTLARANHSAARSRRHMAPRALPRKCARKNQAQRRAA